MLQFARVLPPDVPRVALVDVNNDCVRDSCETARALFDRYRALTDAGDPEAARLQWEESLRYLDRDDPAQTGWDEEIYTHLEELEEAKP